MFFTPACLGMTAGSRRRSARLRLSNRERVPRKKRSAERSAIGRSSKSESLRRALACHSGRGSKTRSTRSLVVAIDPNRRRWQFLRREHRADSTSSALKSPRPGGKVISHTHGAVSEDENPATFEKPDRLRCGLCHCDTGRGVRVPGHFLPRTGCGRFNRDLRGAWIGRWWCLWTKWVSHLSVWSCVRHVDVRRHGGDASHFGRDPRADERHSDTAGAVWPRTGVAHTCPQRVPLPASSAAT